TTVIDSATGERIPLLSDILRKAGRRARAESGNVFAKMLSGVTGPAREVFVDMLNDWQAQYTSKAWKNQDDAALRAGTQMRVELDRIDDYTSPVELMVDHFGNFHDPAVREQILTVLQAWGDMQNTLARARPALQ